MHKSTCLTDDCNRKRERRQWCSIHYRRLLKAGKLPPRTGTCQDCGETFPGPKAGPIPPRCQTCRVGRSTCVTCDVEIPRKRRPNGGLAPAHKYCSDECKPRCSVEDCTNPVRKRGWCANHYAAWHAYGDVNHELAYEWADKWECKTCGNTNKSTWETQRREYCTDTCRVTWRRYEGDVPEYFNCGVCDIEVPYFDPVTRKRRRIESGYCDEHKRSSYQRYGPGPETTVEELAAEDGLLCKLCGHGVDLNRVYPDKLSPSIDHIIPVSKGGTHERDNLQLSHLTCNIRKGNRYIG